MFDTIFGLPIHPLVVHFIVVLLPIWAIYLIYVLIKRQFAAKLNLNFVISIIMAGAAIATSLSGSALASRLGNPSSHEMFGHLDVLTAMCLFIAFAGAKILYHNVGNGLKRFAELSVALGAILALGFTVAAGHTGASVAWKAKIAATHAGAYPGN
jgi:uncharacterized membrane protein